MADRQLGGANLIAGLGVRGRGDHLGLGQSALPLGDLLGTLVDEEDEEAGTGVRGRSEARPRSDPFHEGAGERPKQRGAPGARLGQDQDPLAEGERRQQVDGADQRIGAAPSVSSRRCGCTGVRSSNSERSPSGSCPLTEATRTSARWFSPRRGSRAGPLTSSPGRSSQRRIWDAET